MRMTINERCSWTNGRCEREREQGIWRGAGHVKLCVGGEREGEREDRTLARPDTLREIGRRRVSLTQGPR